MADTAHTTKEQMEEIEEDLADIEQKGRQLAQLIRDAHHFVAFTGAGISTSAGIPDFRGPEGVWTLRASGGTRTSATTSTLKAIPTFTHMALLSLQQAGLLKHLISQNTDGLHRRSGIDVAHFSELHGNSNLERCERCGKEFLRDGRVRNAHGVHEHHTGRKCVCGGGLLDTIINFGENLPEKHITSGFENARQADLCLCLGSSLTVSPACDMPLEVARHGGKLVICNLQRTPLDREATLRIHGKCDSLMRVVMRELGMVPPVFELSRHIRVTTKLHPTRTLAVTAVDADGTPATLFRRVDFTTGARWSASKDVEPFRCPVPATVERVQVTIHWMGNYEEPPFELVHPLTAEGTVQMDLRYNPFRRLWHKESEALPAPVPLAAASPTPGPASSLPPEGP
ncbi:putative Sir2 family protein [Paratrimastix pyriformis]|uniref:Sir2 family protein n=1 Tax=Paratrimastix pyriformis TaxID=342808 RepID=A0ABQ8UUF3_9EUKA|nr:putative Sir2 family protein [Paratrimastix pyriformis]